MIDRLLLFFVASSIPLIDATLKVHSRSLQTISYQCGKGDEACSDLDSPPGSSTCTAPMSSITFSYQNNMCYESIHVQHLDIRCVDYKPGLDFASGSAKFVCRENTPTGSSLLPFSSPAGGNTIAPGETFTLSGINGGSLPDTIKCEVLDPTTMLKVQEVLVIASGSPMLRTNDVFGALTVESCNGDFAPAGENDAAVVTTPPPTPAPFPPPTPPTPPPPTPPTPPPPTPAPFPPPTPPTPPVTPAPFPPAVTPAPIPSPVTPQPVTPSAGQCLDPMYSMEMTYEGGTCDTSSNQQGTQIWCTDYVPLTSEVKVECRENTPTGSSLLPITPDNMLMMGETFAVSGLDSPLPFKIKCTFMDPESLIKLQETLIVTSGSGPIFVGDTFGGFLIKSCTSDMPTSPAPITSSPVVSPVLDPGTTIFNPLNTASPSTSPEDCCCYGGYSGKAKGYKQNEGDCCCCPPGSEYGKAKGKGDFNKNYPGGCDCRWGGKGKGYSRSQGDCPADYAGKAGKAGMSGGSMMGSRRELQETTDQTSIWSGLSFDW